MVGLGEFLSAFCRLNIRCFILATLVIKLALVMLAFIQNLEVLDCQNG